MRRIIYMLSILLVMQSCKPNTNVSIDESNFPLRQALMLPVRQDIRRIAVADTWLAVQTIDNIIAVDINNQETLWSVNFSADLYSEFQIINNDILITASQDQIILIDKQGEIKNINLEISRDEINIIKLTAVYDNYLYVIRGSEWVLEVYDISQNVMLWKMDVGRGVGNVFYSPQNDIAYISIDDSLRAYDNISGSLLWQMDGVSGGYLETGVLYLYESIKGSDGKNQDQITAIDEKSQEKTWKKDFVVPNNFSIHGLNILDNLLIVIGDELIAIDKFSGEMVWGTNVGDRFATMPVEFDGVIYAKVTDTRSVYAISPRDGSIIGHTRLESTGLFDGADELGGVFTLEDGVVFNTKSSVVVYKLK